MRHWWESHFGLLWKHFFERVLLPLTGLQKCNQQSYVLARRVVVLWSMRSNSSSILQFPKQKSWKEGVKLKKKIFRLVDFDASFLLKKLSPWTNFPSCFLHWTNFPIHNSTWLGGLLDPRGLSSVCWRQKLSWREMFSVFEICLLLLLRLRSMLTWPCHALVSVNIKDFFSSLASLANMCRVFQNKSWS